MQLLGPLSTLDFLPLHASEKTVENQRHSSPLSTPYYYVIEGPLCGGPSFEDNTKAPKAFPGGAA